MVRRASLSDRHNLCRKEYETEAIVWRGGREEEEDKEKESDQENKAVLPVSVNEAPAALPLQTLPMKTIRVALRFLFFYFIRIYS